MVDVRLAPMCGITDHIFRTLWYEQGCDLAYTEMISAKALFYKNKNTLPLLQVAENEGPVAVQLFGSEPELLAEEAKKRAAETGKAWPGRILDLCTGSGCIAAWAGHAFPGASVTAADLSEEALAIAEENCRAHESFPGQIGLLQGDLFDALGGDGPRFDVILSNPPYVPSQTVDALEREVKDFEPRLALDGGPEGMDIVARIIAQVPGHLADGGLLLMEIDDTQEELVLDACAKTQRYVSYAILRDLAGKVRYLKASC